MLWKFRKIVKSAVSEKIPPGYPQNWSVLNWVQRMAHLISWQKCLCILYICACVLNTFSHTVFSFLEGYQIYSHFGHFSIGNCNFPCEFIICLETVHIGHYQVLRLFYVLCKHIPWRHQDCRYWVVVEYNYHCKDQCNG